jgi:apolipoprotein N-acyltransferase
MNGVGLSTGVQIAGRLILLAASAIALTLAMAPFRQFYLAWVALVPWLVVVAQARSTPKAFGWGLLGGAMFFAANLWSVALLTFSGAALLTVALAATWGFAAAVAHRCGLLDATPRSSAILLLSRIAALGCVWVTAEWLRGRIVIEFPLLYLAHTQTPILPLCQIADIAGTPAVTFLVIGGNACVVLFLVRPGRDREKLIAAASWAGLVVVVMIL